MAQWTRKGDIVRNMKWFKVKAAQGDTLARIASSVKPAQSADYIMKWNGLSTKTVKAGTEYKVYSYYIVQWGDTLNDIAKSFNTTTAALAKLNPQIKNINKIGTNDKIRLPEGREPEAEPPKVTPVKNAATNKTTKKPAQDLNKVEADPKRNLPAASYWEDDFPPHRNIAGDYFMRIGDVQLVIPPEFIQVRRVSQMSSSQTLRQKDSMKTKNGHSTIMVEMQLWFNDLEEINGTQVPSPITGQKYFMDGLRPLIAQLKRQPFLPVENEFLNDVMDIHALAFSNLSFTTVEGFPGLLQANLTFYKADMSPIIELPTWTYDQLFIYPLFRWYYQQMLVEKGPVESTTHLLPLTDVTFNNDVKFKIINEGALRELKGNAKLKTADLETIAYENVDLPDDLVCTSVFASLGTILSPLQLDMNETSTFQYLGAMDSSFMLTFETTNADSVATLERLYQTMERYSRMYRDKVVSGFVGVQNPLINMCGIAQSKEMFSPCMITDMTVATVPGNAGLFQIQLSLVSFRHTEYQDERTKGFNVLTTEDAEKIAMGNMDVASKYSYTKNSPMFLIDEGLAESMLDGMELYPDLELPTYKTLNLVRDKIDAHRKKRGHSVLPIKGDFLPPYNLYRFYGQTLDKSLRKRRLSDAVFVDPDFYFTYPSIDKIRYVDQESMRIAATAIPDVKVAPSQAQAATAKANPSDATGTGQTYSFSGTMPTSANYTGPPRYAARVAGTDKFNANMLAIGQRRGLDPVFLKAFMTIESSGKMDSISSAGAYGLMQVLRAKYNETKYDWNRMLTDADYAIESGCDLIEEKKATALRLQKNGNGDFADGATPYNVAWLYNGYSTAGAQYAKEFMDIYTGLTGEGGQFYSGTATTASPIDIGISQEELNSIEEFAEADVLAAIPQNIDEQRKIVGENDNVSLIMKGMLHDRTKYSRRGSMMRCFPTYLLMFVDEGVWVDYRRLWNNYWTYHSVQEISIVKERQQPVDTAYVRLQNSYGALNFKDKNQYKAAVKASTAPQWTTIYDNALSSGSVGGAISSVASGAAKMGSYWWDVWFPTVNPEMIKQRKKHVETSGLYLRTGARVHIRMGYGSVASQMPVVFNGRITELSTGDIVEAVCQSDSLELSKPFYDWTEGSAVRWWNLNNEPKEIMDAIMGDRDSIFPVGWANNLVYKFTDRYGKASKYGIEHFGTTLADGSGWPGNLNKYDVTKNIYPTNSEGVPGKPSKDEPNVTYWQANKSPWDVFQFMAGIAPGFDVKVHEHNLHSTLFFGEPHWYIKYKYVRIGKGDQPTDYFEALKPSQQYHHIDSVADIISNGIKTSSHDFCTIAVPIYSLDEKPQSDKAIWLDPFIKPEMQKTEMVDTTVLQDYPMLDWVVTFGKNYIFGKNTAAQNYAWNIARRYIGVKLREMYQGEIVIIGDTAIKPGDLLNIADTYNQMFGSVEVGRVVHSLSFDTGFISSIKPDLLTFHKESKRASVLPAVVAAGAGLAAVAMRRLVPLYAFRKPSYVVRAIDKTQKFIKNLKTIRKIGMASSAGLAAAGPPGWVGLIAELILWVGIDVIINAFVRAVVKERANIGILPLWYKNTPYVAGIDGHRELIPGIVDYNFYPEETPDKGAVQPNVSGAAPAAAGSSTGIANAFVPEGNKVCYPVRDYKKRRLSTLWGVRDSYHPNAHGGIDITAIPRGVDGNDILASVSGKVFLAGQVKGFGNCVILEHDITPNQSDPASVTLHENLQKVSGLKGKLDKFYSTYGHLSAIGVKTGQQVSVGDIIGKMGNTGNSYGTHLHFELRTGSMGNYNACYTFDPVTFLQYAGAYDVGS